MWGLEGRKEEYVPLWITAEEGPGLRESYNHFHHEMLSN